MTPPATAEIIPLPAANLPADLDGLAREINAALDSEAKISAQFDNEWEVEAKEHRRQQADIISRQKAATKDLRIEAGRLLIAAKEKVASGGWKAWVQESVNRSLSDCYACMKLAGATDPWREREKEKADTRDRVQKHRDAKRAEAAAAATSAASVTSSPVTDESGEPAVPAETTEPAEPNTPAAEIGEPAAAEDDDWGFGRVAEKIKQIMESAAEQSIQAIEEIAAVPGAQAVASSYMADVLPTQRGSGAFPQIHRADCGSGTTRMRRDPEPAP
jgi:hypothetical protein